jgi:hypothetical protein
MGSGHKNTNPQRYGRRPFQTRSTLPIVTVVCDDTKTAVAYFNEFKRQVKARITVKVEPAPRCGASPDDVLKVATELARTLAPKEEGDSIWTLLDTEAEEYKQEHAHRAKRRADETLVHVLLSKPCYEVWTLAHFIDTGEAFSDCNAVVARVKAEWKKRFGTGFGSKKGQADYAKLMPLRTEAVKNAKKRAPDRDSSWTEVHKVVEAILALCMDQTK